MTTRPDTPAHSGEFNAADSLRNLPISGDAEVAMMRRQDPQFQPPCCDDHDEPAGRRSDPFTALEHEFFAAGDDLENTPTGPDTFDDLDADYKPVPFWARLRKR